MVGAVDDHVHHSGGGRRGWQQHRVNDVHHAVVGGEVRHSHLGVVDEHPVHGDGHRHVGTEEGLDHLAVGQVCAQGLTSHHVVLQNGAEVFGRQQFLRGDFQGLHHGGDGRVGGREDGERTVGGQGVRKASGAHGCGEQHVVRAACNDVHHSSGHRRRVHHDGRHHALGGVVANAAIVVVCAGHVEGVGADALSFGRA